MMRVLLADDHPEVRSALRLLLGQEQGVSVVTEVTETRGLLTALQNQGVDVVLLDWELPGLRAEAWMPTFRALAPQLVIIALSGRPEAREAALAAGANAFISKGDPPELLLTTLRALDH